LRTIPSSIIQTSDLKVMAFRTAEPVNRVLRHLSTSKSHRAHYEEIRCSRFSFQVGLKWPGMREVGFGGRISLFNTPAIIEPLFFISRFVLVL